MKNSKVVRNLTLLACVILILSLVSTVNAQIPDEIDAKEMAKRFLKYGKIEVIEIDLEKQPLAEDSENGVIKFTGTAVYTPAKIGKKEFKDISSLLVLTLLDKNGLKVSKLEIMPDCGENGQAENVKYKKPFPFEYEHTFTLEEFNKIESVAVKVWWINQ